AIFINTSYSSGQKIRPESVNIDFTSPPPISISSDLQTFTPFIYPVDSSNIIVEIGEDLTHSINIEGFKKVDSNYDLEVSLILGKFELLNIKPYIKNEKITDSESGLQTVRTSCWYSGEYVFPAKLVV